MALITPLQLHISGDNEFYQFIGARVWSARGGGNEIMNFFFQKEGKQSNDVIPFPRIPIKYYNRFLEKYY